MVGRGDTEWLSTARNFQRCPLPPLRPSPRVRRAHFGRPPHHRLAEYGVCVHFRLAHFSNFKSYGDWGSIFGDSIIATAIPDRLLHHSTTINIRGESCRLKDRRKAGLVPPRGRDGADAAARSLASDSVRGQGGPFEVRGWEISTVIDKGAKDGPVRFVGPPDWPVLSAKHQGPIDSTGVHLG
jgi:hypothetical protein